MDHMKQLKTIRAEAIFRLRSSPDFKLAGRLGQLLVEMGETLDDSGNLDMGSVSAPVTPFAPQTPFAKTYSKPSSEDFDDLTSDEMVDELVAEIEGDAIELNASVTENAQDDGGSDEAVVADRDPGTGRFTNGTNAAH